MIKFFLKYKGKHLDYDGAYGFQCVDVIKAYMDEVLGMVPLKGNAVDYWRDIPGFQRIKNGIMKYPKPGDIIIWDKTNSNPYGHIAIVNWVRMRDFGCFEQNNPVGYPCMYGEHSYKGVLGWLRPMTEKKEIPLTVIGAKIEGLNEQVQKWSNGFFSLNIRYIPMDLPYDPTKDYSKLVYGRYCIISCEPGPQIYKTSLTNDLNTAYAIAGSDALTASYEVSHMLHKYYLAHRGNNPYIDIEDTLGGVLDEQRYRKFEVMKPYVSVIIN